MAYDEEFIDERDFTGALAQAKDTTELRFADNLPYFKIALQQIKQIKSAIE
jgi:hypothetical protein